MSLGHGHGCGEDAVVGDTLGEGVGHAPLVMVAHDDVEHAASRAERCAAQVQLVGGQFVEPTDEGAGVVMDLFTALLESVQLLEHGDGQIDVVVLEMVDATVVVQDDVGV